MPALANQRHELFAQQLAKGKTSEEAYAAAGFKPHASSASRLRNSAKVRARLVELQEKIAARAVTSASDIIEQLAEDRDFARFLGAPSAAISATLGQAKVLGLLKERHEHTGRDGAAIEVNETLAIEDKSAYALARAIAFALERGKRQLQLDAPDTVIDGESVRQER